MQATIKIKDVQPGDVFVEKTLDIQPEDMQPFAEHLLRELNLPDDAWCVRIELRIVAGCILPKPEE